MNLYLHVLHYFAIAYFVALIPCIFPFPVYLHAKLIFALHMSLPTQCLRCSLGESWINHELEEELGFVLILVL